MAGYLSYMSSPEESLLLLSEARERAARWTEESWQYHAFGSVGEAQGFLETEPLIHMISWELDSQKSLEALKGLRTKGKEALLLVVADRRLSPAVYLRPSVAPAALLLKPLSREKAGAVLDELFREFLDRFGSGQEKDIFYAEGREGKIRIPLGQIDYFEAREGKIYVRAGREEYGFYGTLDRIEEELPERFLRCHRSFLVNMSRVKNINYTDQAICMQNGASLPFSRRCRRAVKEYQDGR